jgi:anti-sigma regulatory factor (Ser/Thr protein kinase)
VVADSLSFTLRNDLSELERLSAQVATFAAQHGLNEEHVFAVNLALEEVVTNIIKYAYDDTGEHVIDISLTREGDKLVMVVEDDGRPFDPLDRAAPDLAGSLEERQVGGLGIHLVRQTIEELNYTRLPRKNRLILRKWLTRAS